MTWIILLWIFQGYSLFSYQCSLLFSATLIVYHNHQCLSTTFLFILFILRWTSGEGGIWTLAPLLTTCTLSRGVPSASLGTSPNILTLLNLLFKNSKSIVFLMSGEDGIRTHVPLRTNGFQDRLVMTTSIPLRVSHLNQCEIYSIIRTSLCQPFFLHFWIFLFFYILGYFLFYPQMRCHSGCCKYTLAISRSSGVVILMLR